jgi:hypothetical protein
MLIGFPKYLSLFKPWYKQTQAWGMFMLAMGVLFGYFGFIL